MGTMVTLTSTPTLMLSETLMAESPVDTLMLMPMVSFNRFNMLLMQLDSALLTLVCPLLQSIPALLPPSTLNLLLPPPSTQSPLLPQFTPVLHLSQSKLPQRLLKPQLPTLPLLLPLLPQLRERGVRLMPLSSVDIPESSLLPLP